MFQVVLRDRCNTLARFSGDDLHICRILQVSAASWRCLSSMCVASARVTCFFFQIAMSRLANSNVIVCVCVASISCLECHFVGQAHYLAHFTLYTEQSTL